MTISRELLDELLQGCERPEDLLGDAGLMNELKNRGVQDVLISVVDGLKRLPRGHHRRFPGRHGPDLHPASAAPFAELLRLIYGAPTADQAAAELDAFEEKWAAKHVSIAPAWRRAWQEVIPFFAFDPFGRYD